ncbi:MAG: hypothetical protein V3S24_15785 [Candidatus Tectomicrobia bacterium]|jgi:hypothetical protein
MAPKRGKKATIQFQVGRDVATGRFIPLSVAKRRRKSAVIETIRMAKS